MIDQLPQVMPTEGQAANPVSPMPPTSSSSPKKFSPLVLIVIVGLLASAGAAVFIWFRPSTSTFPPQVVSEVSPTPAAKSLTLELTSPVEGEVAVDSEMLVKGKTLPNVTVAIFTETDEEAVESDATGNFETTITLADGINSLTVTAMAEDGQEKKVTLDIVYDAES